MGNQLPTETAFAMDTKTLNLSFYPMMSLKPFHAEGSYIAVRATDIDSGNI